MSKEIKKAGGFSKRGLGKLSLMERDLTDDAPAEADEVDRYWAYRLMDWIEQFYITNGYVPTIEQADEMGLRVDLYERWIKSRPFREELAAKGVFLPGIQENLPEDLLTERQLAAIKVWVSRLDTRSRKQKLAQNGISMVEWEGWMRDPRFVTVLNNAVETEFQNSGYEALMSVMDGVADGDINATKIMLEMHNKWSSKGKSENFNVNLNTVVTQLMEIIMEEVKDPEILRRIGMRSMGVVAAVTGGGNNEAGV